MANFAKLPDNNIDMPFFYNISGTVGPRGHNNRVDVALIQYLLGLTNLPSKDGLMFVYFGKKDPVGHWGNETEARLWHFIRFFPRKRAGYAELASSYGFKPVADISTVGRDPLHTTSLLMLLNASVFRSNPVNFLPANVMRAVPGLITSQ